MKDKIYNIGHKTENGNKLRKTQKTRKDEQEGPYHALHQLMSKLLILD